MVGVVVAVGVEVVGVVLVVDVVAMRIIWRGAEKRYGSDGCGVETMCSGYCLTKCVVVVVNIGRSGDV